MTKWLWHLTVCLLALGCHAQVDDSSVGFATGSEQARDRTEGTSSTSTPPVHGTTDRSPVEEMPGPAKQAASASAVGPPIRPDDSPNGTEATSRGEVPSLQKEERKVAEQFLRDFRGSADAMGLLGSVHLSQGRSAEAVRCWEQCVAEHADCVEAYDGMAAVALQAGQFERVVELSQKIVALEPQNGRVRNRWARALLGLGRTDEAVGVLEEERRLFPRSAHSHFFLGRAYEQSGRWEAARDCYLQVVRLVPNHPQACYQLSIVCQRLDRPEDAQRYRDQFQALQATARADLRMRKGQQNEQMDLASVQRGVARTLTVAAERYLQQKNVSKAEQLRQRAVQLDPNHFPYRVKLGILYAQSARFRQAEHQFRKAIELAPQRSEGYQNLAKVYLAQQVHRAEAKKLAATAARISPTAPNYFLLVRACSETGDTANARKAMEKLLQLEPDNTEYQRIYAVLTTEP